MHVYSFILISFAHSLFNPLKSIARSFFYPDTLCTIVLLSWYPLQVHYFILIYIASSFFYPDIYFKFILISWYIFQVHSFILISFALSFFYPDIHFTFIFLILISIASSLFYPEIHWKFIVSSWYPLHVHSLLSCYSLHNMF